jgi:hypothetical protein
LPGILQAATQASYATSKVSSHHAPVVEQFTPPCSRRGIRSLFLCGAKPDSAIRWRTLGLGFSADRADGSLPLLSLSRRRVAMLTLIIGILIIIVVGAILFWVIDKFCPEARLAQLLKLLVVLVCLGAIVARLLPLLGYPSLL